MTEIIVALIAAMGTIVAAYISNQSKLENDDGRAYNGEDEYYDEDEYGEDEYYDEYYIVDYDDNEYSFDDRRF